MVMLYNDYLTSMSYCLFIPESGIKKENSVAFIPKKSVYKFYQ